MSTTREYSVMEAAAMFRNELEKYNHLIYSDRLQGREIMQLFTLEKPRYKEILELFIEHGKYRNCTMLRMMKNQKVLRFIDKIGVEKFSLLLDRDGFEFEADGSDDRWNNMVYNIFNHRRFIYAINQIDIAKLRLIFGSDVFHDSRISCFLMHECFLNCIVDLDIDKFTVLHQTNWIDFHKIINGMEPDMISIINNSGICAEKLKVLVKHSYAMKRLLRIPTVVDFIRDINSEKFGPLFDFHSSNFDALLYIPSWTNAKFINDINDEKLTFLYGSHFFNTSYEFYLFLRERPRINLLNSFDIKKLEIIFMITPKFDLLSIFFNVKFDVRKHLSFAVALYKRHMIRNIRFKYASNEHALYQDVIKVFPKWFPIRRILDQPTKIESVPRLQDRCIEVYIGHKTKQTMSESTRNFLLHLHPRSNIAETINVRDCSKIVDEV